MSSQPSGAIFNFPTGTDIYSTKVDRGVIVSGESHQVPFAPAYEFYLAHVPQTGTIIIPGYIESTGTPLGNQFQAVYTGLNAGLLTFNGINAGDGPWGVTYTAYGDIVTASWFNDLQTSVVNIEDFIGTGLGITGLYLHVTGGNLTGDLVFNGANLLNASSGNANIGGVANTFGNIYVNNVKTLNTENAGGTNVITYSPNLSLVSATEISATAPIILLDGAIEVNGDIVPQTGGVYNIGSTGAYFNNIYATNITSPLLSSQFVAKSGDSMTGDLTVNTQILTNSVVGLNSSLTLSTTGSMIEVADGAISIQSANSNVSISSPTSTVDLNGALSVSPTFTTLNADLIPVSPNFINLGSSGTPLGTIYATNIIASGIEGNFVARSGDSMYGDLVIGDIGGTGTQPYVYTNNISSLDLSNDLSVAARQIDLAAQTSVRMLIGPFGSSNLEVATAGIYVGQDVIPTVSGVINLGSTSSYYDHVYANNMFVGTIGGASGITISSGNLILGSGVNIEALLSGLSNIGSSGNPIGTIYVDTIISNGSTGTYVQKAGDIMTGALIMGADILATGTVNIGSTGTPINTLYVDSIITTTGSGTYVLKAGDTMTGPLFVPVVGYTGNLAINGSGDVAITASNQVSITSATGIVFIDANTEAQLLANSIIQMTISQTGTQLSNNIFPDISGNYSVGTAQKPFGAIYADTFYTTATSGTGNFVLKIGDTMNGTLNFNSGIGITASNSGTSDIGTLASPFATIYADNLISANGFVHLTGDLMTGGLNFSGASANITAFTDFTLSAPIADKNLTISANSGITITTTLNDLSLIGSGINATAYSGGFNFQTAYDYYLNAGGGVISVQNADLYLAGNSGELIDLSGSTIKLSQGGSLNYVANNTQNVFYKVVVPSGSGTINIGLGATPFSGIFTKMVNGQTATIPVYNEIPPEVVDGINTVFTVLYAPLAGTERVYRAGLRQAPGGGNDYTMAGSTITFNLAPNSGDRILIDYDKTIY